MNSIKLLDGAMGSEFIKRGIHLPKNIWSAQLNLEAQELIHQIHKEYIGAGSNYLTTNTFRTTPRAYLKTGILETEAKDIANVLKAGELPASVEIIEERTVGPSLGEDSINSGKNAMIIGFLSIMLGYCSGLGPTEVHRSSNAVAGVHM